MQPAAPPLTTNSCFSSISMTPLLHDVILHFCLIPSDEPFDELVNPESNLEQTHQAQSGEEADGATWNGVTRLRILYTILN